MKPIFCQYFTLLDKASCHHILAINAFSLAKIIKKIGCKKVDQKVIVVNY